jgi:hypothetical protein
VLRVRMPTRASRRNTGRATARRQVQLRSICQLILDLDQRALTARPRPTAGKRGTEDVESLSVMPSALRIAEIVHREGQRPVRSNPAALQGCDGEQSSSQNTFFSHSGNVRLRRGRESSMDRGSDTSVTTRYYEMLQRFRLTSIVRNSYSICS